MPLNLEFELLVHCVKKTFCLPDVPFSIASGIWTHHFNTHYFLIC